MHNQKLTQHLVDNLPFIPRAVYDNVVADLVLRIAPTSKSWCVKEISNTGKRTLYAFAKASGPSALTLPQARKQAQRIIASGGG